jgi:hypothetical protein
MNIQFWNGWNFDKTNLKCEKRCFPFTRRGKKKKDLLTFFCCLWEQFSYFQMDGGFEKYDHCQSLCSRNFPILKWQEENETFKLASSPLSFGEEKNWNLTCLEFFESFSRSEIGSLTAQKEHNFFHQLKSCLTILANEIMCLKLHSSNCHKQFTTKKWKKSNNIGSC